VWTFDLLALGLAALITAGFTYGLGIDAEGWKLTSGIFLVASAIALAITRILVLPKLQWWEIDPMSKTAVIGTTQTIQEVNGKTVIRYEGNYRNLETQDTLIAGDKVVVNKVDDNRLHVSKQA